MNTLLNFTSPLQNTFWSKENSFAKQAFLILTGIVGLAVATQLSIPLSPIPLTFQSATVILIGMMYGPRRGVEVVAGYLLAGACGLPVFSNLSSGLLPFMGPTAGYLVGFLPAAFISGYLAQQGFAKNIFTSFIAASIGASVIFLMGVSFLSILVGSKQAIAVGVLPFIISEPVKLFALACIVPHFWKKK